MTVLLYIILAVCLTYILFRLFVSIYRPLAMEKVADDILVRYTELQDELEKDIQKAGDNLRKWKSGEKVMLLFANEDKLEQALKDAWDAKDQETKVYEKYVRLRERFVYNRKKLAEAMLCYKRYLFLRIKHIQDASLYPQYLEHGVMTFEETCAAADESRIAIQESERKLDVLLGENPPASSS